jgi:HIRAN domain
MFRLTRRRGGTTPAQLDQETEPQPPPSVPAGDDYYELSEPNVDDDWAARNAWVDWEPPRNFVAGESHHMGALAALTGPPRQNGYLVPVSVRFVREPNNPYDANALRAEVNGLLVGYLRRHIAAQAAPALDRFGCVEFSVCGIIRGGQPDAPNIGVHIWLGRRTTAGPEFNLLDQAGEVAWPPHDHEGH